MNTQFEIPSSATRYGFHFFNDEVHFTDSNLEKILALLPGLNASWLILEMTSQRAIPEFFIRSLIDHHISPIVMFNLPLTEPINPADFDALLTAYANWGVKHVVFFESPNLIRNWTASSWVQQGIVDRFLDRFIPLAELAIAHEMTPFLPSLTPGGDIWDTIFFRQILETLQRRSRLELLDHLGFCAYGWTLGHCLNWGAGGSEFHLSARAYSQNPADGENQLGFRTIDWYNGICDIVLQRRLPAILLEAGSPNHLEETNLAVQIAQLCEGETVVDPDEPSMMLDPLPENVTVCTFQGFNPLSSAGFALHTELLNQFHAWLGSKSQPKVLDAEPCEPDLHPIDQYVLLPSYEWGIADWHLDVVRSFVKKHRPVVGFNPNEARLAKSILAIGDQDQFSEAILDELRQSGCRVERISGNGTSIATSLAQR